MSQPGTEWFQTPSFVRTPCCLLCIQFLDPLFFYLYIPKPTTSSLLSGELLVTLLYLAWPLPKHDSLWNLYNSLYCCSANSKVKLWKQRKLILLLFFYFNSWVTFLFFWDCWPELFPRIFTDKAVPIIASKKPHNTTRANTPKTPPTICKSGFPAITAGNLPQRSQHVCSMDADAKKRFRFSGHATYFP